MLFRRGWKILAYRAYFLAGFLVFTLNFAGGARAADPGTVLMVRENKYLTLETKEYTGTTQDHFLYIDGRHPVYIQVTGPTVLNVRLRRAFHPDFPDTLKPLTLTVFEGQQALERHRLPTRQDRASDFVETELLVPSEEVTFSLSPSLGVTMYALALPKKAVGGAVVSLGKKLGRIALADSDIFRGKRQTSRPAPASPPVKKAIQPAAGPPRKTGRIQEEETTRWFKLVEMGIGLNVNYLLSLGSGERYLSAPAFLLEYVVWLPSNESFFVPGARNTAAIGIEGGYYFSGGSETRQDSIRGVYEVKWDLQVIPVYLNVYYRIPFSRIFSLTAGTGIGVNFVSLAPEYETEFDTDNFGPLSETPVGVQFIGAGILRTGSIGEVRAEMRYSQVNFSPEFEESRGDISGLSFGLGYYFLF